MLLDIVDKYTRQKIEMIRTYDYVQYVDEFIGEGKFQINLPISDVALPFLKRGNYIIFEKGIVGIIKSIKDSQEENMQIIVSGKLTNHILTYRSILKTERYSGNLSYIARSLVENHFINPEDEKRKIDLISLSSNIDFIPDSNIIKFCDTGNDIRKSIANTFAPYGYGFELYPVLDNFDEDKGVIHNLSSLEFRVIKPVDRTIGNKDGNTPVVFAFQLSNLSRLEYEEDGSSYCSVAIVASEGTGQERTILEVGSIDLYGLDRIELYVDARDITSTDENGEELTEEEFMLLMEQRGLEKLEGHKVFTSFDGNVITSGDNRYTYGIDFYKGDYVSIIDDKFDRIFNLQITSVTKSISQGVEYFDVGFGLDKVTVNKLIDTSTGGSGGGVIISSGGSGGGHEVATTVTVKVNSVTTGEPGTKASVVNVGDDVNVKLDFIIPEGEKGKQGPPGSNGISPTVEIGEIKTVNWNEPAKVTNVGTPNAVKLNFELPKGKPGEGAESLSAQLGGFSFGYTDDGKPGYKEEGADTFVPFSDGSSGGSGYGREVTFSSFTGNGYKFCVIPSRFADGSLDEPKTFYRSIRTVTFSGIVL